MTKNPDLDPTLPSVVADLNGRYSRKRLTLTIAFHPDTRLIGRSVRRDCEDGKQHWVLGRNMPLFEAVGNDPGENVAESLGDSHLSRAALQLTYTRNALRVERQSSACRCQRNGHELAEKISLDTALLEQGGCYIPCPSRGTCPATIQRWPRRG